MSPALPADEWESFLEARPEAHLLQSAAWGELKSSFGWECERIRLEGAGAQVLFRRLSPGMILGYVPLGPVGDWLPSLLPSLDEVCRRRRAFALKIEPDGPQDASLEEQLQSAGLVRSPHSIQPRRTLLVDLTGQEDEILSRMGQKTRYNIGLAGRRGVLVEPWDDLDGFGSMMQVTAQRDRFGAHSPAYYREAHRRFAGGGGCLLLVARVEGRPVAALMAFARGNRAWYLYGASTDQERQRMPTYLLQWEAMRWARSRGCTVYDLWGVPDEEADDLESKFASRSDGLWGVYRFKRGFGGRLVRSLGAWDRVYRPIRYAAYRWLMARRMGG